MKVITANRLTDGAVVYWSNEGAWTSDFAEAARFDKDAADDALAKVAVRVREITEAYLVETDDAGVLNGRTRIRETIRTSGPTVRPDLGYQAEAGQ